MEWSEVLWFAAAYTGVFALAFVVILLVGALAAPGAMSHDYPEPIRARYGPKTPRDRVVTKIMSVLMALLMLGSPIVAMTLLARRLGGDVGFLDGFVVGVLLFTALHVFDLVVVDWLFFCTIQPSFMVLPGTAGMAEYRDYAFHWKVLVPRPVPWPLLLIPAFGVYCGLIALVVGLF